MDLASWNNEDTWFKQYPKITVQPLFFAMDIFGDQFCFHENEVYHFLSETGELVYIAKDLEEWTHKLLGDYDFLTGYSFAHEWQKLHGPLKEGERLIPIQFFVFSREYEIENFKVVDAIQGMKMQSEIVHLAKKYPDGTKVKIEVKKLSK